MLGAGIVLLMFGMIALWIGKSLEGGHCDILAGIELIPKIIGFGLVVVGGILSLAGFFAR